MRSFVGLTSFPILLGLAEHPSSRSACFNNSTDLRDFLARQRSAVLDFERQPATAV